MHLINEFNSEFLSFVDTWLSSGKLSSQDLIATLQLQLAQVEVAKNVPNKALEAAAAAKQAQSVANTATLEQHSTQQLCTLHRRATAAKLELKAAELDEEKTWRQQNAAQIATLTTQLNASNGKASILNTRAREHVGGKRTLECSSETGPPAQRQCAPSSSGAPDAGTSAASAEGQRQGLQVVVAAAVVPPAVNSPAALMPTDAKMYAREAASQGLESSQKHHSDQSRKDEFIPAQCEQTANPMRYRQLDKTLQAVLVPGRAIPMTVFEKLLDSCQVNRAPVHEIKQILSRLGVVRVKRMDSGEWFVARNAWTLESGCEHGSSIVAVR